MSSPPPFLDAPSAAASLGVSKATLYAYVSRGLISTHEAPDDPRRRLYSAQDIDLLRTRKATGRRPSDAAAASLDWGLPVLSSGITLIDGGRLSYRGQDATRLAQTATIEDVAQLLWDCGEQDPFANAKSLPPAWDRSIFEALGALPLTERCQSLLPLVPAGRTTAWQRDTRHLWTGAAALLRAVAAAASHTQPGDEAIHVHLARAWSQDVAGADLIRRALVLVADHELNASAFAVRVVASTGASLGACLNAGLSGLSGPLHGGTTSLVEMLFDEVDTTNDAASVVDLRLRRGEGVPGFGHPLYPEGDARASALLPLLPHDNGPASLVEVMEETTGKRPTIDFALVAIRRALRLPRGSALALFATGRTVGWIAHALEQRRDEKLIRPRARYTGPPAQP